MDIKDYERAGVLLGKINRFRDFQEEANINWVALVIKSDMGGVHGRIFSQKISDKILALISEEIKLMDEEFKSL